MVENYCISRKNQENDKNNNVIYKESNVEGGVFKSRNPISF